MSNIEDFKNPGPVSAPSNGGSGSRISDIETRLAKLETRMEFVATKEDIQTVLTVIAEKETKQTRWLVGILISAAVALALAIFRTFM